MMHHIAQRVWAETPKGWTGLGAAWGQVRARGRLSHNSLAKWVPNQTSASLLLWVTCPRAEAKGGYPSDRANDCQSGTMVSTSVCYWE